jgi:phage tail protein X
MKYVTNDGDTVDEIVWRHYAYAAGAMELVFSANAALAFEPPILAAGLTIELPDLPSPKSKQPPRLWE